MHLRRIELRDWACHDALALDFAPGLNVVVGPNGVGKSTLFLAIRTALTVKHSASGKDVGLLETWGTSGSSPSLVLSLVRDDGPWELRKSYLNKPSCLLRSGGDGALLKDRAAEEQLAKWVESDGAAGRLVLTLWSPQDDPTRLFAAEGKAPKVANATLMEQLVERAGKVRPSEHFALLKDEVARRYGLSFTPQFRDVRKNSELDLAVRELADAAAHHDEVARRRLELDGKIAEYQRRESRHHQDCAVRERLKAESEARRQSGDEFRLKHEALIEAQRRAEVLGAAVAAFQADDLRLAKAGERLARARARSEALGRSLGPLKAEATEALAQLSAADERRASGDLLLDDLARLTDRRARLDEGQGRVDQCLRIVEARRRALDAAKTEEAGAVEEANAAASDLALALARHEDATRSKKWVRLDEAEEADRDAAAALDVAEVSDRLARRKQLIEEAEALRELTALGESKGKPRDEGPIPSAADVLALTRQAEALRTLDVALSADSLSVRFRAFAAARVRDSGDGGAEVVGSIAAGGSLAREVAGAWVLEIEGVGRIEIGRSSPEPAARLQRRDEAAKILAESLLTWKVASPEALADRQARDGEIVRIEKEIRRRFGGKSPSMLDEERAEIDAWFADRAIAPDSLAATPVDAKTLELLRSAREEAGRRRAAARARCEGLARPDSPISADDAAIELDVRTTGHDRAQERAKTAEVSRIKAEAACKAAEANLRDARDEHEHESGGHSEIQPLEMEIRAILQQLVASSIPLRTPHNKNTITIRKRELARDAKGRREVYEEVRARMEGLERELSAESSAVVEREAHLEMLRREIPLAHDPAGRKTKLEAADDAHRLAVAEARKSREEMPPDPSAGDELEERLLAHSEGCDRVERELLELRSELKALGSQGLDSVLAAAIERRDRAEAAHAAKVRDASAWALLHHILAEVEAEHSRGMAARLEGMAEGWVARLSGRSVAGVRLDPQTLAPHEARAAGLGLYATIGRFSRGTREQVALACRLQVGLLLSQEGRPMLLLDDPLAHTDPHRHHEALDVLAEAAEHLQILVFTCHRDRYGPLWERGQATRIELGPRG